jgi:hypothetical protein
MRTRPPCVELIFTAEPDAEATQKGCVCPAFVFAAAQDTGPFSTVLPASQPMAHRWSKADSSILHYRHGQRAQDAVARMETRGVITIRSVTLDVLDLVRTPAVSIPVGMKMT